MRAVVATLGHREAAAQLAAGRTHVVGQRAADGGEVDDAGAGRVQGGDAGRVRLDLAQPVGVEAADAGHPVGARTALELVEGGQLVGAQGDDELAERAGRRRRAPRSSATIRAAPSTQRRAFSEPGA